jgi:hypothetical protein
MMKRRPVGAVGASAYVPSAGKWAGIDCRNGRYGIQAMGDLLQCNKIPYPPARSSRCRSPLYGPSCTNAKC